MHITIENNTVIVNLDETEFPLFEAMFLNLKIPKQVSLEFRHFPGFGGNFSWKLLPMHLCRTIGEANLSADPFATVSLYPFWKYGFAFGTGGNLELALDITDPHKKAVSADEFGMGFCAWAMEEIFQCETWADASSMIESGMVVPTGSRAPDFVCTFPDGSLGIFEAKGTTGTTSALTQALASGKQQAMSLTAESPIRYRVVIGTSLGGGDTKIILVDPPAPEEPIITNLTADIVRKAAKRMRTSAHRGFDTASPTQPPEDDTTVTEPCLQPVRVEVTQPPEDDVDRSLSSSSASAEERIETTITIFRGPRDGTGTPREIVLTNEYKPEKKHNWLEINT